MRKLSGVLVLLALAACASAPVQRQFDRQVTIPGADFDAAWNAIVDIFGERNWTIANMEKASGFINSEWMDATNSRAYVDCGSPGMSIERGRRGRFNLVLREAPGGDGVTLTVNTTWQAEREFGGSYTAIECASTGELEAELQEEVRERVGA